MYVTKDLKPKIAFSYCRISYVLCIIRNLIFSCFYFILTIRHIGSAHCALSRYILYLTDKGVMTFILVLYIICTGHSFSLVYFYFCSPHFANPLYLICIVDTPIVSTHLFYFYFASPCQNYIVHYTITCYVIFNFVCLVSTPFCLLFVYCINYT